MTEASTEKHVARAAGQVPEVVLEYSPEIESSKRRLVAIGFLTIILGFGGLGTWAAMAPLKSAAVAPGVIKVASESKLVQHLEGGIVKEIHVRDGDVVERGDVLLQLDDVTAVARKRLLRARLDGSLVNLARLEAERDEKSTIDFPAELLERKDDPEVRKLMDGAAQYFESRQDSLTGEIDVLNQRIGQLNQQIKGQEEQIRATRIQWQTIREELDAVEVLYKKGIYEKPRYLALKRNAAGLVKEIARFESRIAEINEQIGEIELRIIDQKKQRRQEIDRELQQTRASVFDDRERLAAAEDTLSRLDIRAPVSGTVVGLNVHTVGGVIGPGATILNIVPMNEQLVVEAQVRLIDIDVVHEGLEAEVQLPAFDLRSTPTFAGRVVHVSADAFQPDDPRMQTYYRARVEIDAEEVASFELYPGMPAEVFILTGEGTVLEYFLRPIQDALRRGFRET